MQSLSKNFKKFYSPTAEKLIRTPFFPYIIANQINNIYHTTPLQN